MSPTLCGSPTVMSNEGFAACSILMLGCICRGGTPPTGDCTGGGPFCLTGRPLSLVRSGESRLLLPKEAWEADEDGRTVRFCASSFRGGVGACSEAGSAAAKGASPPRGPRGSLEPSTTSRRVGWAPILRAGVFREPAVFGVDRGGSEAD